jgi:NADPH2:quinone reductase
VGKAVFVREVGGPEALEIGPHDPGAPGPGQALVRVAAAGVNFIDVYFRTGLYPRPLPFVSGLEGAGVVEALGPGVEGLAAGDSVAWASAPGSYAERVLAPADRLVRVPEGVAAETAAAVMLQGMTAHYLSQTTWRTSPGDVALVHAAAGGVGLLLIQMLKKAGATVIGTCSTVEKEKLATEAGADHVVRYTERDFAAEARELSDGRGVDVVFDSVGQSTFDGSLSALRPRGMLVSFGQSSGPIAPFDVLRLQSGGSLFLTRPSLAHYTHDRAELEQRASAVLDAVRDGSLSVRIGACFPLADAGEAHRALEGRRTTGKVLLGIEG